MSELINFLIKSGYQDCPVGVKSIMGHKEYMLEALKDGYRVVLSCGPNGEKDSNIYFEFDENRNLVEHRVVV